MATTGSFSYNFASLDSTNWTGWDANSSINAGRGQFNTVAAYSGIHTTASYDFTGSYAYIQAVQCSSAGNGSRENQFLISTSSANTNNSFGFIKTGTNLGMRTLVSGADSGTTYITYNATSHAWWRVRNTTGSTVVWETSPDGTTWTTQRTATIPFAFTTVWVSISSGYYGTETSPEPFLVDNYNGNNNSFTFTASVSAIGLHKKNVNKAPFTGASTAAGVFTKLKVVVKTLTASVSSAGAFIKIPQKLFAGSSSVTGVSTKTMRKTFIASSTPGPGTFRKASVRRFTATVSATGAFTQTFLGRVFGRPGRAVLTVLRAGEAIIRVRRN